MRITPLTAHIGAAVEDIDITTPLDETTRTSLRAALCRRGRCCSCCWLRPLFLLKLKSRPLGI